MKGNGIWVWIGVLIIFCTLMMTGFMATGKMLADMQQISKEQSELITMHEQQDRQVKSEYTIFDYIAAENKTMTTREIAEFVAYVYQVSNEEQVDPYLIFAICDIESDFYLNKPGRDGERGPMQLMESTWALYYKQYGFSDSDFENWFCNTKIASVHFKGLLRKHKGNADMAIYEYNGGPMGFQKTQSQIHLRKFQIANRGVSQLAWK
jgi:hypothetical protein